jgi:predicted nucleotidyltransferase
VRFSFLDQRRRNELRSDSDIDIAVRGLPPARFFAAASKATDILGRQADLMDLDDHSLAVRYVLGSGELIGVL